MSHKNEVTDSKRKSLYRCGTSIKYELYKALKGGEIWTLIWTCCSEPPKDLRFKGYVRIFFKHLS